MVDFDFHLPTKILFGRNKEKLIGEQIKSYGIKKVLLLYGRGSIKKFGLYDVVIDSLKKENIEWVEFDGVASNPLLSHAYKGIKKAKENNVEAVLAVGGGSVIDEAKPIAVGAQTADDIWDYYTGKTTNDALPIFSIVTLAASCSYMNNVGVITHDEQKIKTSMKLDITIPKVSIINPEFFFTLSPDYIAYSGVDTLSHAIEPYLTYKDGSELQNGIMESIIKATINTTNKILKNHKDYNAWSENIWASSMAHNKLAIIGVSGHSYPNHMCEHSLSALYNIPHGAGLSIIIPAWMKWYKTKNINSIEHFANKIFNLKDAEQGIIALENWFKEIKSPTRLSEINIKETELDTIADNIMQIAKLWGLDYDYNKDTINEILKLSL